MIFGLTKEKIKEKIEEGAIKASVFGLGRVGLPLSAAWLRAGLSVIGADINQSLVNKVNKGVSPVLDEPYISDIVKTYVEDGRFRATTDLVEASMASEVKFIAVPTTHTEIGFNSNFLESALRDIAKGLKEGDALSIECTLPPTTTERWAKPLLEKESGLQVERDFALVYSPERIYEGRILEDLEERYPKIVGGVGPKSTQLFSILYSRVAKKGVIKMSSATAAELSKLFEGVYRDVNIALVNELSDFCHKLNIDFMEVRAAANTQPYSHLHKPGVGVGGACLPYYPYFLAEKAEEFEVQIPLTRLARSINEGMPQYTVSLAEKAMKAVGGSLENADVAILGLAFRGDISDARNSPTYHLIDLLQRYNVSIVVHDPLIQSDDVLSSKGIQLVRSIKEVVKRASLVIVSTDHREYMDLDLKSTLVEMRKPIVIIDGRNIILETDLPQGVFMTGIGKKTINLASA